MSSVQWKRYEGYAERRRSGKLPQAKEKAKIACKNSGHGVINHFPDIRKMAEIQAELI